LIFHEVKDKNKLAQFFMAHGVFILPPMKSHYYDMRKRSHDHELPNPTHATKDCNFLIRLLSLPLIAVKS